MRIGVVVNPISGRTGARLGARRAETAIAILTRLNVHADVSVTARAGHAQEIARAFVTAGCDRVVAWGGDGTVNEVAGAIISTNVAMGIVPCGSGDGLARSLGLHGPTNLLFERALTAEAQRVDVGYLGERHFLNIAGIGFDAAVAAAFNSRGKRGLTDYVRNLLTMVWSHKPARYRLVIDGEATDQARFLVAFANGREYGNRMVLAPAADPSDGWLDVVLVDAGSPVRQLWRARRLAIGHGKPAQGVSWGRCRAASVSGERLQCHVDGESFETSGTLDVRIAPGAIRIAGAGSPRG
jgi:YegS/Rv2252/BmrU family lipid kinase